MKSVIRGTKGMNIRNQKCRLWKMFFGTLAVLGVCLIFQTVPAKAESGSVYSCTINRSYSHPVTGEVEDSGGKASQATGQGMVEGCVASSGLLEVTDSGKYYLTIRLGLMDYTSKQSFSVQKVGDNNWTSAGTKITGKGSDSNGTTADVCIEVPNENCIVRGSMYVTPMGRNVIFYFYPSDYKAGNSVGMKATFVTADSTASGNSASDQSGTDGTTSDSSTQSGTSSDQNSTQSGTATNGTTQSGTTSNQSSVQSGTNSNNTTQSGITSNQNSTQSDSDGLDNAQGLSLSTADEESADTTKSTGKSAGAGRWILILTTSLTISGVILMLVAAVIVWYFRKNWRRWGGEDDEDYDE